MTPREATKSVPGGAFRCQVSDSAAVPLRGHLLRLKVVEGSPSMKDLAPGRSLTVVSPDGEEGRVSIIGHGAMSGRARQDRLDRIRELDLVISSDDAAQGGRPIGIGWFVTGPAS